MLSDGEIDVGPQQNSCVRLYHSTVDLYNCIILYVTGPLFDENNSTCITTAESESPIYRKLLEFPICAPVLEELPVMILGSHLLCGGRDGLKMYVNTAANPGTDMCSIGQPIRECSLTGDNNPAACKFLCPCPVHDWGCKIGLLRWNRQHLSSSQSHGQICEVVLGLDP